METFEQVEWPLRDETVRSNFLRTMKVSYEQQGYQLTLLLWEDVSEELWIYGYWNDYLAFTSIAAESARCLGDLRLHADLVSRVGWVYMERGAYGLARACLDDAHELAVPSEDLILQNRILRDFGTLSLREGRPGTGLRLYLKALNSLERAHPVLDDSSRLLRNTAELHNLIGNVYLNLGDKRRSGEHLYRSVTMYRSLGSEFLHLQAAPLINIGHLFQAQGDYSLAERAYMDCMVVSELAQREDSIAGAFLNLGVLEKARGNDALAEDYYRRSELHSGREFVQTRDQAIHHRTQLVGPQPNVMMRLLAMVRRLISVGWDLLFSVPVITIRSTLGLGMAWLKLTSGKMPTRTQQDMETLLQEYETSDILGSTQGGSSW